MSKKIDIDLAVGNVGPHQNFKQSVKTSSLKLGIYAPNGTGKSFLSKCFRLIRSQDAVKANKLLSFGKDSGSLELSINDGSTSKKLDIYIKKGAAPTVSNKTDYIFHVFNNDYTKDNLETYNYKPNGEIEGYILGKIQIDLTNEKINLNNIENKIQNNHKNISDKFANALLDLEGLGIRKSITEYKNFSLENLMQNKLDYDEKISFKELLKVNTKLNTMPDDIPDILAFNTNLSLDFLDNAFKVLSLSHEVSRIDEAFKGKVVSKQSFIQEGLKHLQDDCPFCEQSLSQESNKLIQEYKNYFKGNEASVIDNCSILIRNFDNLTTKIKSASSTDAVSKNNFNKVKEFIPSFSETTLEDFVGTDYVIEIINKFISMLKSKIENIEIYFPEKDLLQGFSSIKEFSAQLEKYENTRNKLIQKINSVKNDSANEKLIVKKRLCTSKYLEVKKSITDLLIETNILLEEKTKLNTEILLKENSNKSSKKDLVAKTFETLLSQVFEKKYSLDHEKFCLKFEKNTLLDNASDVLSDGEKSIVSFCFFLAETHTLIGSEEDYDKLFFIIDDPISSMDFHYVYSISQLLRRLELLFNFGRSRFLLLTHNIEFMSLLIRNNIISDSFCLSNNELKSIGKELLMPYEQHLKDVYDTSIGNKKPSHTTPNSIRHILETVNRFENPYLSLREYLDQHFSANVYIYSMINDSSHGVIRNEKAYLEINVINSCKDVIDFINTKFSGQIKLISSH
ncbi:AAA family ATPase [Methylobacillus glycogenes]|uniref:AAA family ATPase n=1 Tax=Methylobacillus glycogenes TaxID=406 RepID=UPI000471649E|nr:AAA family ATPase [Methylobacillus glycogenes]